MKRSDERAKVLSDLTLTVGQRTNKLAAIDLRHVRKVLLPKRRKARRTK